jgi:SNF2 family DNA or RNA helicase
MTEELMEDCTCGKPHVVAVNYECVFREPYLSMACGIQWDFVIADESHRICAPNGTISKAVARIGRSARRRLALTGTPMPQEPLNIFGQFRFLDPDVFGPSWTSFSHRYAVFGGFGGYEVVGYANQPELDAKFRSLAFVVGSDVLDLPPERDVTRGFQLGGQAARAYRALSTELWAGLDAGEVTAPNALVKLLRLQQITGGNVTDDDGVDHIVDQGKKNLLRDVLEDIAAEECVVVVCRFVADLAAVREVAEKLKREYRELSGRCNDLNSDARIPEDAHGVFGVQIQSGGVGVDLSRSANCVLYSVGYSLGEFLQVRARLVRPGQDRSVLFVRLVAEGTVDEAVYEALQKREDVVDTILRWRGQPPSEPEQ